MHSVKKDKSGIVAITKPRAVINLDDATQEQLKRLFEIGHPFVIEVKEKK